MKQCPDFFENSKETHLLTPQKRKYLRSDDPMTEASILYGLFGDFYVSLGEPTVTSKQGELPKEAWDTMDRYDESIAKRSVYAT